MAVDGALRRLGSAAAALLCAAIAACAAPGRPTELRVAGSDTMVVLNRRLAAAFMDRHPGTTVVVDGGGTAIGIAALIAGSADIAAASRPLAALEVAELHQRTGSLGLTHLIALDALSVVVHPANPVRDLSRNQIRALFAGQVTTWAEVGGGDLPVVVVIRSPASGTYAFFRDHVLAGGTYASGALTAAGTAEVVARAAADPAAVGYAGVAHHEGVVQVAVDGVPPTAETARGGRYPLARYLVWSRSRRRSAPPAASSTGARARTASASSPRSGTCRCGWATTGRRPHADGEASTGRGRHWAARTVFTLASHRCRRAVAMAPVIPAKLASAFTLAASAAAGAFPLWVACVDLGSNARRRATVRVASSRSGCSATSSTERCRAKCQQQPSPLESSNSPSTPDA
jgi:phosphate transport system substrate-binding protein